MSAWQLAWHPAVRHDVGAMHRGSAKEVVAALRRFADRGEGRIETLGEGRFALRVEGAVSFFHVDTTARQLQVLRVLPTW